ncbi:sensor histidine kinase [Spirillospora sp. CA-294931]|uniref:sensor histidine kinase n=1 Tax=Spirillospora sp. CA-294931 TaxID=3240042 RepID=UPI003D8DF426
MTLPARLRALAGRTPLRVKLIAGMLILAALGMAVMSVAGVSVLRGYLTDRADTQLFDLSRKLERPIRVGANFRIPSELYAQLRDPGGAISRVYPAEGQAGSPKIPAVLEHPEQPFTVSSTDGDRASWRVLAKPLPDGGTLVLGISLDEGSRTVARLTTINLIVGLIVLGGLAALGVWLVHASLRPLRTIEATAGAIAAGDLARRVPEADPRTEIGRLGRSLNTMLAQIEAAFGARAASEATARRSEERMRRFVADASHELRTPLTAIRGFAEFYRQGAARDPEELDRLIGRIEQTAERMGLLVEDLLLLARLDRQRPVQRRPVDLLAVAADAVQETRVVAPDRSIELSVDGGVAYQVLGDETRLRQVLGNLLSNAVKHTPESAPIEVRLLPGTLRGLPAAVCEVADQGPGLTPEQAERVFERFYQADPSRGESAGRDGGTGLGLSIVAALVAAHEGTVMVDTARGIGSIFRVVLPLAAD